MEYNFIIIIFLIINLLILFFKHNKKTNDILSFEDRNDHKSFINTIKLMIILAFMVFLYMLMTIDVY